MREIDYKNSIFKVEVDQIWEVQDTTFLVNWYHGWDKKTHPRKVLIEKGERIEIRFPHAWHFRTVDNQYFQVSENELIEHCTPHGVIWENVEFQNTANLEEILRLGLYYNWQKWLKMQSKKK